MREPWAVGVDEVQGSAPAHLCGSPPRRISPHSHSGKGQARRFLIANRFRMTAAFLAMAFGALLLPEAFDADLAVWPIGAEDFTVAADASFLAPALPLQQFASIYATPCFGPTEGARLIMQHRARSALTGDHPLVSTLLNMAEPCQPFLNAAPVLGHFFHKGPGNDWNVSGRTRATHLGRLPHAFALAGRFSS